VRLATAQGSAVLRATLDAGLRRGEVFVPMHWGDGFASAGPVARLVGGACDPVSGQPELKATPVVVAAVATAWRGLLLHSEAIVPAGAVWSRVPLATGHAFDLSGMEALPGDVAGFAGAMMGAEGAEVLEMADASRGVWRFAALRGGRLEACLYLAVGERALPSVAALRAGPVAEGARLAVLAGSGAVAETPVCACFAVGLETIRRAIVEQGMSSVAEIGAALKAGTNCGSCVSELRQILRRELAPAD